MSSAELIRGKLRRLGHFAGLDAQVISTLLLRGWSIIAGTVMLLLIPIWLGKAEQGYYYTFSSLLALQIFFELGMGQVIVQMVGHDFAHVRFSPDATLEGSIDHIARLASLIRLLRRWYRIAAVLFLLIVSVCGFIFFSSNGELPISSWLGPWLLLTLATAINLYLTPMLTVLEGCGEVAGVARMRLVQSVLGYSSLWLALILGAELWAMTMVPLAAVIYSTYWLRIGSTTIDKLLRFGAAKARSVRFSWYQDIFPFQWRIAVSWISGYFIFQLFIPLAFARLGAIEAGRLGISLAVFSALLTVGMSWVNAKVPAMAGHVARNERASLNSLFNGVLTRSMAFTLVTVILIVGLMLFYSNSEIELLNRFSSLPVILCLALVTLSNCYIYAAAAYMRAHKEEPMMWVSVVAGLGTLMAAAIGARYSVVAMMIGYTVVNVCIALPWTIMLFIGYYRRSA